MAGNLLLWEQMPPPFTPLKPSVEMGAQHMLVAKKSGISSPLQQTSGCCPPGQGLCHSAPRPGGGTEGVKQEWPLSS